MFAAACQQHIFVHGFCKHAVAAAGQGLGAVWALLLLAVTTSQSNIEPVVHDQIPQPGRLNACIISILLLQLQD